jgi:hypothetical protein
MTVFVVLGIFTWIVGKQEKAARESTSAIVPIGSHGVPPAIAATPSKVERFKVRRSVVQRITLTYIITLSSVGDLKARGPALFRDTVGWADAAAGGGLSMGFYPLKCALGWGFYSRLWGTMLLPLFMAFLMLL